MSVVESETSVVVLAGQLQRQVGVCALCGQPAVDQGWVRVRCIENSFRAYRWSKGIVRDPKKYRALSLVSAVTAALVAVYAFEKLDWPHVYLLVPICVIPWIFKSPWSDIPVPLPHCGQHKKLVSTESPGNGSKTARFWDSRRFRDVIFGILIAYAVFLVVGAFVVATPENAFDFYWRYFFLPMLLLIPTCILISLFLGIRRFVASPYGVASGSDLIEIWHLSPPFCEAANLHRSDVQ